MLTAAVVVLGLLGAAAPVQADPLTDLWNKLPIDPPDIIIQGTPACAPDDPICHLTCELMEFDDDYANPEVDPNSPDGFVIKAPGPGDYEGRMVLLGHWTICLPL